MKADPTYMDLDEFRDRGYLQEVNRQFFHPLGLALAVNIDEETGKVTSFAGLWDERADPEGIVFSPGDIEITHVRFIEAEVAKRAANREALGLSGPVQDPEDTLE